MKREMGFSASWRGKRSDEAWVSFSRVVVVISWLFGGGNFQVARWRPSLVSVLTSVVVRAATALFLMVMSVRERMEIEIRFWGIWKEMEIF